MRQLTFIELGELERKDVPEPTIKDAAEAIVRPVAVATCDIDRAFVRGQFPAGREFAMGHEGVAEILDVGEGVSISLGP